MKIRKLYDSDNIAMPNTNDFQWIPEISACVLMCNHAQNIELVKHAFQTVFMAQQSITFLQLNVLEKMQFKGIFLLNNIASFVFEMQPTNSIMLLH